MPKDIRRVHVISFDFKQPKGTNQSRKTRFFRELYGYTQQVKQRLKNGKIVERTYYYPGVLDQLPYTKLGKSVLAVQPGKEGAIIQLFREFDEVVFYNFIGWLPNSLWPMNNADEDNTVSTLIVTYGYLSILMKINNCERKNITHSTLIDAGFDINFIKQATSYLTSQNLLIEKQDKLELTKKGKHIITHLLSSKE